MGPPSALDDRSTTNSTAHRIATTRLATQRASIDCRFSGIPILKQAVGTVANCDSAGPMRWLVDEYLLLRVSDAAMLGRQRVNDSCAQLPREVEGLAET